MASSQVSTFSFTGEPAVERGIVASLEQAGFSRADSSEADVIFTYCVAVSSLEDTYYDSDGILQTSKKDAVLVDLSPSTVSFARELNAMGSVNDRHVIDAPLVVRNVMDKEAFAHPENLGMVVGGVEEVFKRIQPMLRAIANQIIWMGKAGSGQATKVALTLSTAASLVGLVESYISCSSSDIAIDQEDLLDCASSFGLITPMQELFLEAMSEDEFEGGSYTLENLMGELAAALASVDDGDVILPQAESGFRLMELLAMVGGISYNAAALKLVFADEETSKKYGLDWSRAEGAYEHSHDEEDDFEYDYDYDEADHECECGHDHNDPDHECCGHHHHHHHSAQSQGFIGFSSN